LPALPSIPDLATTPVAAPVVAPPAEVGAASVAAPPVYRTPRAVQRAADISGGRRGGKLALAAAIGLGLIALTVELDRRKMRRAQIAAETGD
jgi:hypothetical protein